MNEGSSATEELHGKEWAKVVGEPALKPSATELTSRCAGLLAYGPDLRQRRVIIPAFASTPPPPRTLGICVNAGPP